MSRVSPSSHEASLRMARVRQKGTDAELSLRKELHARGLRYRLHVPLLTKPRRVADIVFASARVAIFVDGCFWHGCPEHGRRRHDVNGWYWPDKIARNRRRDRDTDRLLTCSGWLALRFWEHELTGGGALGAAMQVKAVLEERRPPSARKARQGRPPSGPASSVSSEP